MPDITQTCRVTGESFVITEADQGLLKRLAPEINGQLYEFKLPTLSPRERQRKRMMFRNDRTLHHRKCDLTGRQIIALYSAESPYTIYDIAEYWSDKWNALDYGRDFDFSRPFFEQFKELQLEVPRVSLNGLGNENSPYVGYGAWNRNCHLIFTADKNEDCYYGYFGFENTDCLDWLYLEKSELCYELTDSKNCYHCLYSTQLKNCTDCILCMDCIGCTDCFGSVGLRNQKYCFFNEQLSPEDYKARVAALRLDTHSGLTAAKAQVQEFFLKFPRRAMDVVQSENVIGDHVQFSRNVYQGFDIAECEDIRYASHLLQSKDCMDFDYCGYGSELAYEIASSVGLNHCAFCNNCWYGNSELYYCELMSQSKDCFGCIGMKNAQYCIFNKQYSKEEYEALLPRIIQHMQSTGEWGEFFPYDCCPYGYNETVAQDHLPLTEEEANARGLAWSKEREKSDYQGPSYGVPDGVNEVPEDICSKILTCEVSGEHYKIIPQELVFYKKNGIPLPRRSPNQRHKDRLAQRNPWQHWQRQCGKCLENTWTSYTPNRAEIVYCNPCYNAEIY